MSLVRFFLNFLLGILGIILISSVPVFFQAGTISFNLNLYIQTVIEVVKQILNPNDWIIYYVQGFYSREASFLSFVSDGYVYSMTILGGALFFALFVGFILGLITFLFPRKLQNSIKRILNTIETMPDVIFIFLLQLLVVWFYKQTGSLLFEFVYLGDEKIYFAPILALSLLPTVMFYKIFYLLLEEEWQQDYVNFAKSKGLNSFFIVLVHCIRNIRVSLFYQSKPIVWAMLSSLLVIEYLYNFYGIVRLVLFDSRPFVIAMTLLLIYLPFFLIYNVIELVFIKTKDQHRSQASAFRRQGISFTLPNVNLLKGIKVIGSTLTAFIKTTIKLLKKPAFLLGLVYIVGLTIVSSIYGIFGDPIEREPFLFDENGRLKAAPPFPPGDPFAWGSDPYGYSVLGQLIVGAKYTIFFSGLIAFLRVAISYLLSIPYLFWFGEKTRVMLSKMADGMLLLPLSLITYILVRPIVFFEAGSVETTMTERIVFEVVILTVLVIPVVLNVIGNEMNELAKSEFIQSSVTLGSSRTRIFFAHLTPHMVPRLFYLFGQQMIQVLYVFIHLGIFQVFFGGSNVSGTSPVSETHEWAGMISYAKNAIFTGNYWYLLPPLLAYVLLILSIQAVVKGYISEHQRKVGIFSNTRKENKLKDLQEEKKERLPTFSDFDWLHETSKRKS